MAGEVIKQVKLFLLLFLSTKATREGMAYKYYNNLVNVLEEYGCLDDLFVVKKAN